MAESDTAKTRQLEADCNSFSATVLEALSWINDARNAERVHADKKFMEEDLRKSAFQARKLAQASTKPMCVGVFGPSQAGKSYLVSIFARKSSRLMAVFEDAPNQDFIAELNPKGGKEATGLVTRFTIRPKTTPKGFPVALRLLN